MKLLIADDNAFMRRLIRQIVGQYFQEIFECKNGFDAVQLYKLHQPDWVLMDLEMPSIDGLIATSIIKEVFPMAKIIIVTKYNDEPYRQAAKKVGAFDFIAKDNLLHIWSLMMAKP
ncbi:MAG: response regulator [Acidobacteriota bacterium]